MSSATGQQEVWALNLEPTKPCVLLFLHPLNTLSACLCIKIMLDTLYIIKWAVSFSHVCMPLLTSPGGLFPCRPGGETVPMQLMAHTANTQMPQVPLDILTRVGRGV